MTSLLSEIKIYFHKFRTLVFVLFLFFMTATFSFFATSNPIESSAVSAAGFKPGNIISDAVMANYNSMTVAEIQAFLTSKNPCNNRDYSAYVQQSNQYPSVKWHWTGSPSDGHFVCISEERFGDGTVIGEGQTAAEIIYNAAQDNKINPQVLLVLLEKEQSLISDPIPHSGQYRAATGYGCPDTAACDSKYYGFKNQVYRAAELFRYTLDHGYYAYPEKTRGVYVAYNPSSSCGRSEVYIENRATAALYRYTPYQPNAAALNAGFGMGDSCSAYGNRNFYLYFTQWFGSTQAVEVEGNIAIIPDGTYNLASTLDESKVLNAVGTYNGANIQLGEGSSSMSWHFKRDTNTGYYTIADKKSGKFLSVASSSMREGTNVALDSADSCVNKWKIYEVSDHSLVLESACALGMVLNISEGSARNGQNVQVSTTNKGASEHWKIHTGQTVANGVYTISSSQNRQKMIDIAGGSNFNGNNIQIWDNNYAGAQKWRVEYNAGRDSYTLTNPDTGKRFDLSGANTAIGTNINLWQPVDACSQYWKIVPSGDYYTILSTCSPSRAVDLVGGNTANTTNIRLWEVNNANAEKWQFHDLQVLEDGDYVIAAKGNRDYVLDIVGAINADGVNVNLYQANDVAEAQLWTVRYNQSTGDYTLLNYAGNRSLDLAGGEINLDTNIRIWSNNTSCAQRWTLIDNHDESYSFISACECTRALDLVAGAHYNANNIRLWETNTADAQKWHFIRK